MADSATMLFGLLIVYALCRVSADRLPGTAGGYTLREKTSCDDSLSQVNGYVASASDDIWYDTTTCGMKYNLTCDDPLADQNVTYTCKSPSVFITVTITDHCKPCVGKTIELATDAFNQIATYDANSPVDIINIVYSKIGDGLDSSLSPYVAPAPSPSPTNNPSHVALSPSSFPINNLSHVAPSQSPNVDGGGNKSPPPTTKPSSGGTNLKKKKGSGWNLRNVIIAASVIIAIVVLISCAALCKMYVINTKRESITLGKRGGVGRSDKSLPVDARENGPGGTGEIELRNGGHVPVDASAGGNVQDGGGTASAGFVPVDTGAEENRQDSGDMRSGTTVYEDARATSSGDTREIEVISRGSVPVDARAGENRQVSDEMGSGRDDMVSELVTSASGKQVREFIDSHNRKEYSHPEISEMTDSFKEKLGDGGYGTVYKGKLPGGKEVAVKVLNGKGKGVDFVAEARSLTSTAHKNCIKLLGYCDDQKNALIYEFMKKGSLKKFIHAGDKSEAFSDFGWKERFKVALGVAKGLRYLHTDCKPRILHLDIKPDNILLNDDFEPKLSDFGLARICMDDCSIWTKNAAGTPGYTAPEVYVGNLSTGADIYAYGMLLIEMVGGRKNYIQEAGDEQDIYAVTLYKRYVSGKFLELPSKDDDKLGRKMAIVGLHCLQKDRSRRPEMNKVLEMLTGSLQELEKMEKPVHPLWETKPSSSNVSVYFSNKTL